MPTIRGENGKQVRVTMGDILRGTRRIKVEKAEVAARKRAKSLDKSLDDSATPQATSPQREVRVISPKTAARNSKSASKKVSKAAPTEAKVAAGKTKPASGQEPNGFPAVSEWTPDQDARLKRLKGADAQWREISALMEKSIQDLKARWADLRLENDQNNSAAGESSVNSPGWNSELDAHLRGLKEAHMPWKEIANIMGKTVSDVKARWSVLPVTVNDPPQGDGAQQSRQNRRQVSFATPLVMPETGGARNGKARKSTPILFIDEDFGVDDVVLLNKIAARCEEEKWLRIISRFFDKTGKRITLEQAKARVAIGE